MRYFRALVGLPGGIRWFVSCDVGASHCRLRHLGWEKSGKGVGHGLTSRPRELASEGFLNELLVLFGYPSASAAALLGGELLLRYCSGKLACRVTTWGLPARGHIQGLIAEFAGVGEVSCTVAWLVVLGCLVVGEFLGAYTLQDVAGMGVLQSRPKVWKRLRVEGSRFSSRWRQGSAVASG